MIICAHLNSLVSIKNVRILVIFLVNVGYVQSARWSTMEFSVVALMDSLVMELLLVSKLRKYVTNIANVMSTVYIVRRLAPEPPNVPVVRFVIQENAVANAVRVNLALLDKNVNAVELVLAVVIRMLIAITIASVKADSVLTLARMKRLVVLTLYVQLQITKYSVIALMASEVNRIRNVSKLNVNRTQNAI